MYTGSGFVAQEFAAAEKRNRLVDAGLDVSVRYTDSGRPAKDILKAIDTTQADLIAMTTHGRSGIGRLAYGSIVEYILRQASMPMLVLSVAPGRPVEVEEKYLG